MNEVHLLQVLRMVANGSYFVWPDGTFYRCEPFTQATVVDTTGAGDSFHGAFSS